MSVEKLTFETAVALGKLICPPELEFLQKVDVLPVADISKELGIHLNSIKRWIAESVFIEDMPVKWKVSEEFDVNDGEPLEILAFYVCSRLGFEYQKTLGHVVGVEPDPDPDT